MEEPTETTGENVANSCECKEEVPQHKNDAAFPRKSASVRELRSLYVEEEIEKVVEESSPRGVLDEDGLRCLESETSSSKASTSCSTSQGSSAIRIPWRGLFHRWGTKSMRRLSSFPRFGGLKLLRGRSTRESHILDVEEPSPINVAFKPSWKSFTILELQNATNNFSPENIIGKGGYAEVYKGCLDDGQLVAIKRLTQGTIDVQTSNFLSELGIIVHVNHPNTAKLIGFGVEGGMHLVFQLSHHGSLASFLHGSNEKLDWGSRYKVAVGTAEGLDYLHERCQRRIIHRDIKSSNILLTENFEPQICDFGLAKWLPDKLTHQTFPTLEGTFGYLAPEYLMHGIVDEKTDVFAFGVLLLELISGRKAIDSSQQSLVLWAKPLLENNNTKELVDPSLGDAYDSRQLSRATNTAYMCIQQSSILRPRMNLVLKLLKGCEGRAETARPCKKPVLQRTYSEELFDAEEYNATRYLNDLQRLKKLALDF